MAKSMSRHDVVRAETLACGEDFCFVCKAREDHYGKHTKKDIVAWTERDGIMQSIFWAGP